METDFFVIPDLQLENPDQMLAEIQGICSKFDASAAYEPQDDGRFLISVSRPVPAKDAKAICAFLGIQFSTDYWPKSQTDLKIEISGHDFEKVHRCLEEAKDDAVQSVQSFAPNVVKDGESGKTISVYVPAANDSAWKQDTVRYYLSKWGLLDT